MKEALIALALAVTVVPVAAAFGAIDHPRKVAAVDAPERGLGYCKPIGERTDEKGQVWVLLECESGAFVILPVPPDQVEARRDP